jgi:hypothetical protein
MWKGDLKKIKFILLISQNLAKHTCGWSPLEPQHKIEKETTLLTRRRQSKRFLFITWDESGDENRKFPFSCQDWKIKLLSQFENFHRDASYAAVPEETRTRSISTRSSSSGSSMVGTATFVGAALGFSIQIFSNGVRKLPLMRRKLWFFFPTSLSLFFPLLLSFPHLPQSSRIYIFLYIDTVVSTSFFRKKSMSCQLRLLGFLSVFVS